MQKVERWETEAQGFWPNAESGLVPLNGAQTYLSFSFDFLLFIYLAVPGLSCGTAGSSVFVVACGILSGSIWTFSFRCVGSSSQTRDRSRTPYTGSATPSPLDHQGSPQAHISNKLPEDAVAAGQWITCWIAKPQSYTVIWKYNINHICDLWYSSSRLWGRTESDTTEAI